MAGIELSDSQVHKARHALGLTRARVAYRNYYVCTEDADWEDLCAKGAAVRSQHAIIPGVVYHLTEEGAFWFLDAGESLSPDLKLPTPAQQEGQK